MSSTSTSRRVPAEWEPLSSVWLAWPHSRETWPDRFDRIPTFYADWISSIAETIPVRLLVSRENAKSCESTIGRSPNVELVDVATNDCWVRDYGPTFVVDESTSTLIGVNWRYNAWGGKYPPWTDDDRVAKAICRHESIACHDSPLCLEGGAMEIDGTGRLITTPDCLITDSRNQGWTRDQIENELRNQIGVREFIWLTGGGLVGDDTDGHIDQLARFIDEENVVAAVCDDRDDPNAVPLAENFRQLQVWAETTSPRVTIHRLSIPPARRIAGQRVPESYCNFLRMGPDRCQVPIFGATSDAEAIGVLSELVGHPVETIDCRDLVWGLGALHCASRDQPRAPRPGVPSANDRSPG